MADLEVRLEVSKIAVGEISCNIDFKYVYYGVIRTCLMPVVVLSLVISSCQNTGL